MEIIPALDIINGKCVRLTQGDFNKETIYSDDPLIVAKNFEDAGLHRLHLVDLDGARLGKVTNIDVLKKLASGTSLSIDFGGGIKSEDDVVKIFEAGASIVSIGSLAAKNPLLVEEWIDHYGEDKFMVGADVLNGKIRIGGWQEDAELGVFEFIYNMIGMGVIHFFCTDIAADGMLKGPSLKLYGEIIKRYPNIKLTASGGISSIEDIYVLKAMGCSGVIIGKAIYEKKINLEELVAIK
ncbi:MAG: 1-(5-phosphoribosyl)-5-[(5-phosphoribosylamino)methylideneamino]imidazole-4-carboxamide isomerase [Chitinophagaceae bacterium]